MMGAKTITIYILDNGCVVSYSSGNNSTSSPMPMTSAQQKNEISSDSAVPARITELIAQHRESSASQE